MKSFKLLILNLLMANMLSAQWSDPHSNIPVVDVDGTQWHQMVVADDEGGYYVIWEDERNGINLDEIFAQHFDSLGNPSWSEDGIAVAQVNDVQRQVKAVSDDAGGVIIAWRDHREESTIDIYMQRLDKSGQKLWGATGKGICVTPAEAADPELVKDGKGGALVAWRDGGDFNTSRVKGYYMQRVDKNGNSLWTPNGELVHPKVGTAFETQVHINLAHDGKQGGILVWNEQTLNINQGGNIFGHHMDSNGVRHWPSLIETLAGIDIERGFPITSAERNQIDPLVDVDVNSNIFVCWQDHRNPNHSNGALYAQKLDIQGNRLWDTAGVMISADEMGGQGRFDLEPDAMGGCYFYYLSTDVVSTDIVHFTTTGSKDWGPTLISSNSHSFSAMRKNSKNGVAMAWVDAGFLAGQEEGIMTQHYDLSGNKVFAEHLKVSTFPQDKVDVRMALGPNDQMGIAWIDWRRTNGQSHTDSDMDLYAQGVSSNGTVGTVTGISKSSQEKDLQIQRQQNLVNILIPEMKEPAQLHIYNINGQLSWQNEVPAGQSNITISTSNWPAGVYLLYLQSGEQYFVRKFIR